MTIVSPVLRSKTVCKGHFPDAVTKIQSRIIADLVTYPGVIPIVHALLAKANGAGNAPVAVDAVKSAEVKNTDGESLQH